MAQLRGFHRSLVLMATLLVVSLTLPLTTAFAADNNINFNELLHDSRDPFYRSPTAAVTVGTEVRLRLRALDGDLTNAQVRVWNDAIDTNSIYNMTKVASGVQMPGDATLYEIWEATLPAAAQPTIYWYRFIVQDGSATAYYEEPSNRTGGVGQALAESQDLSWQLTHYEAGFQTPDWVKNAVIYQIFPDRFRNGDVTNDPPGGEFFYGEAPTLVRSGDASAEWNTPICDPRAQQTIDGNDCAGIYSQNFYGGDLQGISDKLDYLQSLGVTALYLNPIFESPSNHKYDTTDFMQIDDNFGTLQAFIDLTTAADARGMHIILDGVFNHSSSDSIYFDRYSRWGANGDPNIGVNDASGACESLNSPFASWYPFRQYDGNDTAPCSDNRDYFYWFNIFDSLPVIAHDAPGVRDYFINNGTQSVGPFWMQYADGWRLDVAGEVDHGRVNDPADDYWEDFRDAVRAVNPDTYIVGEEWGNATSWLVGGEWDANMQYQFGSALMSFWRDEPLQENDYNAGSSSGPLIPIGPTELNARLLHLQERSAPEAFHAMMNLFGSHDTNRVLFLLDHNADQNNASIYNDPNYDWSDAIERYKGALILQMTLPGAPTIYYGNEVGLVGPTIYDGSQWQDDPYNRQPYPWLDETGLPFYSFLQSQQNQDDLYNYHATLAGARNNHPALRTGSFDPLLADDAAGVYAFGRKMHDDSDVAVILVNQSDTPQTVTLDLAGYVPTGTTFTDELNGGTLSTTTSLDALSVNGAGELTVTVPADSGNVLTAAGFSSRPATVQNVNAAPATGEVVLTWDAAANADSYNVYRSSLSGGLWELVESTTQTSFTDSNVENGVTYFYVVEGVNSSNLLNSADFSAEVGAQPTIDLGADGTWWTLQWPPTIGQGNDPQPVYELSAVNPTTEIYGQIYIQGQTDSIDGQVPGIRAQVGFGAYEDDPTTDPDSWTWFEMAFNGQAGNNDEYKGNLRPTAIGDFIYTVRFSTDDGTSWYYGQLNPPGKGFDRDNVGQLTVSAPADQTAPAAPQNLQVLGSTTGSVTLGWDAFDDVDGDLFGFEIYRADAASQPAGDALSNDGFEQIGTVNNPQATVFVDSDVVADATYDYYIVAVDERFNRSVASNTVSATAEQRYVDVTFIVAVPDFTPGDARVYVAGSFEGQGETPLPNWNPGGIELTNNQDGTYSVTLSLIDGAQINYKYARGNWERVEKQADGFAEVPDRPLTVSYDADGIGSGTQTINDTVLNWRDPLLVDFSPAADFAFAQPDDAVKLTWNKNMPATLTGFDLTDSGQNAVTGTFAYDGTTFTHTFTPDAPLAVDTFDVSVAGNAAGGDPQQIPFDWSFTVVPLDETAPSAPTGFSVTDTSETTLDLMWDSHPNDDGDTAGFKLYINETINGADAASNTEPAVIINDRTETAFTFENLTPGTDYTIGISAFDNVGNESTITEATGRTDDLLVDVTFTVQVPPFTPSADDIVISVDGDTHTMTPTGDDNKFEVVLALPAGQTLDYYYTRGNDATRETEADGETNVTRSVVVVSDSDEQMLPVDTVANWDDPLVVNVAPPNNSTLPGNATFWVEFSQAIDASALGTATFTPLIAVDDVAATAMQDVQANIVNYMTDAALENDFYDVILNDVQSADGDAQVTSFAFVFASDGVNDAVAPLEQSAQTADPMGNTFTWSDAELPADAGANTGDAIGYRVYRLMGEATEPDESFEHVATRLGAENRSYTDMDMLPGQAYSYYVTAFDAANNASLASNVVQLRLPDPGVDITINVTVPAFTPDNATIYLAGQFAQFGFSDWSGADVLLTETAENVYSVTFENVADGVEFEYKVTRGSWDLVEKAADGDAEIAGDRNGNRLVVADVPDGQLEAEQTVDITVENWRDPLIVSFSPEADATAPPDTVITVTWSQAMPETLGGTFALEAGIPDVDNAQALDAASEAVAGSFSYDAETFTHTFTPGEPLPYGFYTVTVADNPEDESTQQVPYEWTFLAQDGPEGTIPVTFNATVPDFTPADDTIYIVGNFGDGQYPNSPYPSWDPGAIAMTQDASNPQMWSITLWLPPNAVDGNTDFLYKYTRGDWVYVEKEPDGDAEVNPGTDNRTLEVDGLVGVGQTQDDTIANWRDPIVTDLQPADGAQALPDAVVTIQWSQRMPETPNGTFTFEAADGAAALQVLDEANNAVAGSFGYNADTFTHTFTPDAPLTDGDYTVVVSEWLEEEGGDERQRVDAISTFNVIDQDIVLTAFDIDPDHFRNGSIAVSLTVANTGTSASVPFDIDIYHSDDATCDALTDTLLGSISITGLAPASTADENVTVDLPRDVLYANARTDDPANLGTPYESSSSEDFCAVADGADAALETNETNNSNQGLAIDRDSGTYFPWDVDGDGTIMATDIIPVIFALGSSNASYDFDGNGVVTPIEIIDGILRLGYTVNSSEVEGGAASAVNALPALPRGNASPTTQVRLEVVELDAVPGLTPGEAFNLNVYIAEANSGQSVFSGYVDLNYNPTLLRADGIRYGVGFDALQLGEITPGRISTLGAVSQTLGATNDTLVAIVRMTAQTEGIASIQTSTPDDLLAQTATYGVVADQRNLMQHAQISIGITPGMTAPSAPLPATERGATGVTTGGLPIQPVAPVATPTPLPALPVGER